MKLKKFAEKVKAQISSKAQKETFSSPIHTFPSTAFQDSMSFSASS